MLLRIPAFDGILVLFVQKEPLLLAGGIGPGPHQDEAAAQFVAVHIEVELPLPHRASRVGRVSGLVCFPGALVPYDDIPAAVLAGRDYALEVEVVEGVVFDMERRSSGTRVQGGPFGTAQLTSTPSISRRRS